MGILSVHGATNRLGRAQDLLHHTGEILGHRSRPHNTGGVDDVVHGDIAVVLDVLDFLTVTGRFLRTKRESVQYYRQSGEGK